MWPAVPLRRIFRVVNGGTPAANEENWNGNVPWATPVDLNDNPGVISCTRRTLTELGARTGSKIVEPGSIIVSTRAPIGYVARAAVPMAFNQGCRALSLRAEADSRFFVYHLLAAKQQMDSLGLGTTFQELSADALAEVQLSVPPLEEQRRIVDYLDAETFRIDQVIELRRAQLVVIDERSFARDFHAVAGTNEPGNRTQSGLDWLGDIPAGWPVMSVNSQFSVDLGKMLNQDRIEGNNLRPYLRNTNVQWDRIDTDDLLSMEFPEYERKRYGVLSGDLLICEGGQPGRAAIWDGRIEEIYYQKALHRARTRGQSSPRWLYYCLRAATALNVFAVEGNSTTISHLTGEQLAAHRFPFPSRETQERLTNTLDYFNQTDRDIVGKTNRQLNLLAERKQALITAAVTGQIDVTTAGRATSDLQA